MKGLSNNTLRAILGIILGLVLLIWPDVAVIYLVILIGVFFVAPGVYKLIGWFRRNQSIEKDSSLFPVDAIGSILFGGWLIIMPAFFVSILMYVLGVLLLLGGGYQLLWLIRIHKQFMVAWFFYLFPSLILLTGIFILAYPFRTATTTFMVFGATSIIYGISELVNGYKFRS